MKHALLALAAVFALSFSQTSHAQYQPPDGLYAATGLMTGGSFTLDVSNSSNNIYFDHFYNVVPYFYWDPIKGVYTMVEVDSIHLEFPEPGVWRLYWENDFGFQKTLDVGSYL